MSALINQPTLPATDALADFTPRDIVFGDSAKTVYVAGHGPAVVVLTEMPGISPQVARFARWVREAGFTVYMPSLFGRDGETPGIEEAVAVFRKTCISAEFRALGDGRPTPVVTWLRALAHLAHTECGGPGVGAVGMCFTGNFALSMMLEAPTLAPVICQPSTPLDDPAGIDIPADELRQIRARLDQENLDVLGYRFEGDKWCTAQRFAAYRQALGPRFVARVLPDSAAHPEPPPLFKHVVVTPHSVVTAHLIDRDGEPTCQARDEILHFLAQRLGSDTRAGSLPDARRAYREAL